MINTERQEKKMSEKNIIYKYKAINNFTIDSLKNRYHYFSKPSQLNDPFDCRILLDKGLEKYSYELKTEIERTADCWRILSLTSDEKNKKMWGLYADSYKGICIGYKYYQTTDAKQILINRNDDLAKIKECYDEKQFYGILTEIDYKSEKYRFKGEHDAEKAIKNSIQKKDRIWEDEKECRVILPLFDGDKTKLPYLNSFELKLEYDVSEFAEIIFGYEVPLKKVLEIKEIIDSNYKTKVDFYVIQPNYISNILEKRKLINIYI